MVPGLVLLTALCSSARFPDHTGISGRLPLRSVACTSLLLFPLQGCAFAKPSVHPQQFNFKNVLNLLFLPSSLCKPVLLETCCRRLCRHVQLPAFVKPAALTALANVLATLPAHAEAGKIFDFNLTGPIMATQFLLLMVFLDKTWFGPVGKVLDERDSQLRKQLGSVRDNSSDVGKLQVGG